MPSPTEKKVFVLYGELRTPELKAMLKEKYKVTVLAENVKIPGYKMLANSEGTVIAVSSVQSDEITADIVRFGPKGIAYLKAADSLEDTLFSDQAITVNGETMAVTLPLGVPSAEYDTTVTSGDFLEYVAEDDRQDIDDAEEDEDSDDDEGIEVEDVDEDDLETAISESIGDLVVESDTCLEKIYDVVREDLFEDAQAEIVKGVAKKLLGKFIIKQKVD